MKTNQYHRKYFVNKISKDYGFNKKTVREVLEAYIDECKNIFLDSLNNIIVHENFGSFKTKFRDSQVFTNLEGETGIQKPGINGKFGFSDKFKDQLNEEHEEIIKKLDEGPKYGGENNG